MPAMRPFGALVSKEEALSVLMGSVQPLAASEPVATPLAAGRVLAEDVVAPLDVPGFTRSTMDGYAVRASDTRGALATAPRGLRLLAVTHAGDRGAPGVSPGTCVQIATGGKLPPGADAVVRVEDTRAGDGDEVLILETVEPGESVSAQGSDIARGAPVLRAGDVLTPARVGVLASLGITSVRCVRRPRALIVPTGNEIVELGQPLGDGQVYNSNGHALAAVLRAHGAEPTLHAVVGDTVEAHDRALLDAGRDADLLLVTGGSSVGERDLLADVVRAHGEVLVHGIRVKPGKPLLVGRLRSGQTLVGLPGNPTSCLMNAYLFVVPALRRLAGLPPHVPRTATLPMGEAFERHPGRYQYVPVRVREGRVWSTFKDSGSLTSMGDAEGYIGVPEEVARVGEGTPVTVTFFD